MLVYVCAMQLLYFHISDPLIKELKVFCNNYLQCHALFLSINQTVWTIGQVVPEHTSDMFNRYGKGFRLNSMEGREAKHIFVRKYSVNTLYKDRWKQIFRHEFILLIWLRSRGYNLSTSSRNRLETYVPARVKKPDYCYCGMVKDIKKLLVLCTPIKRKNKIMYC